MSEPVYHALLLIPANRTALGLAAIACFLVAALLGLFFLRGHRPAVALLFGLAHAGVYLALIHFTDGTWGFWLHEASGPLLDLLGAPIAPLDGAHRTLYYGAPAGLHGLLAGGLTLFLWKRLTGPAGDGSAPDPAPDKTGGRKAGGKGKGRRK